MPISVACPKCEKKLNAPDAAAGKKVRCPACKAIVSIPEPDDLVEPDDFVEPESEAAISETPASPKKKPAWDDKDVESGKLPESDAGEYAFDEGDEKERISREKKRSRRDDDALDDIRERQRRRGGAAHRGILILVLGILSIFSACLCIIPALILARITLNMAEEDLSRMAQGTMDKSGQPMAVAGKACAYIGILVSIVGLILNIAVIVARFNK